MKTDHIFFYEKPAQNGVIGEIILNRPKALNALTLDMCQRFNEQLMEWEHNDNIKAVIVKGAGDRAFCAGGDIRALYNNRDQNPELLTQFFWHEYRLNATIHHFTKPYFAFLHHITMGGGAGVSIHGTYRIATENLCFAMPETKIGFYPDIGASYFLNQCPNYSGLYLALTGNSITAAAAYELGLVTHIIPDNNMVAFEFELFQAKEITEAIMQPFAINTHHSDITEHRAVIDACFSKNSVAEIMDALNEANDWTRGIAKQLAARCPTSLKITFEAYHRATNISFDDIMQMNFDITQQFLVSPDFFEGVRAAIIDKDQAPKWQPLVSDEDIEQYFQFKGSALSRRCRQNTAE